MLRVIRTASLAAGLLLAAVSFAQIPSGAPASTTGMCKDGSYWSGPTKQGACRGHKGVNAWYAAAVAGPANASAPAVAAAPAAAASAGAVATAPARTSTRATTNLMPSATAASGGGPGLVWVNKSSKVYHCSSDRWYGKTKEGVYMSEADAKAQGNRPDHGKACQ